MRPLMLRAALATAGICTPVAGMTQEASPPVLAPSLNGPLKANPDPLHADAGPLGNLYVTGAVSGIGLAQSNHFPGDENTRFDISNAHLILQTAEGPVQVYAQLGAYSQPSLGVPYFTAKDIVDDTYGLIPVAYVKFVPSGNFNVQIGKLLTLQGGENTFTFQNFNVQRGLLWNQTNAVNRGVQANYANGRLSASLSLNDGYYSGKYNWLSGMLGYAISSNDTITVGAAANVGQTRKSSFATPTVLNNGELYFLSWTRNKGPVTLQSYVQLGHVPEDEELGIARSASTYGASVLGKYSFTNEFALAGRAEYIKSSGSPTNGAPSLIYGPGSAAWSITATPTWQKGLFFVRGEASYVRAHDVVPGLGLGRDLDKSSQVRGLVEAGILF